MRNPRFGAASPFFLHFACLESTRQQQNMRRAAQARCRRPGRGRMHTTHSPVAQSQEFSSPPVPFPHRFDFPLPFRRGTGSRIPDWHLDIPAHEATHRVRRRERSPIVVVAAAGRARRYGGDGRRRRRVCRRRRWLLQLVLGAPRAPLRGRRGANME